MKNTIFILGCCLALAISGCASTQKAELSPGIKPDQAYSEANELMTQGAKRQSDLLSFKEYSRGLTYLEKARRGLEGGYQTDYILENAASAKGYFQQALENTDGRSANATRILQARWAALQAGLQGSPDLRARLVDVDEDVRDETDNFDKPLEPMAFAEFQKQYFALEIKAVQFKKLDAVKQAIQQASKLDAEDLAPKSLRMAMLDVNEAGNMIAQSPRDQGIHGASVAKSVASAMMLTDVMDVILGAPGTPEDIAVKIVHQNRELGNLKQDLSSTRSSLMEKEGALEKQNAELQSTRSSLQQTETALMMQNEALEKTSTQVRFQKAMDEAMKQFSEDDAAVYQQGNKLIFRIKTMNFGSGSAAIPSSSKPLLSKIDSIIQQIGAEMVAVQGHTDSIGSAQINKDLSTKRAVSVANYLASLSGGYKIGYIGYGESRPIASNDTKEGRAINRRVDLVVTARK